MYEWRQGGRGHPEMEALEGILMNSSSRPGSDAGRRPATTLFAFLFGLPLAAAVLLAVHLADGPVRDTQAYQYAERYLAHPVGGAEVVLFCCALGGLLAKLWYARRERLVARRAVLPQWDGRPVPVSEAQPLLASLDRLPSRLRRTFLVRRVSAVLDFLCQRRSARDLDHHLQVLVENDALALESSYSLLRFITWAIPILGFLGTVLGITGAIAGIAPETLEDSLSGLTDGLALAFDSTALALTLTMITMFCTFVVERREQSLLEEVDHYVDRQLAHRFEREESTAPPLSEGGLVEAVQQQTNVMLEAMTGLVHRQAEVWAQTFAETNRHRLEQQDQLTSALETALERTLNAHTRRLADMEQQVTQQSSSLLEQLVMLNTSVYQTAREHQEHLARVAGEIGAQATLLGRLQEGEAHLIQLQTTLQHNLHTLATTGAFEQTLHTLTAAIHLLTASQASRGNASPASELRSVPLSDTHNRPGRAA